MDNLCGEKLFSTFYGKFLGISLRRNIITMKYCFVFLFMILGCMEPYHENTSAEISLTQIVKEKSYDEIKIEIDSVRNDYLNTYHHLAWEVEPITTFWIETIGEKVYSQWENTPWDFNGTTETPKQGAIACGFFVTTVLRDMGVKINRTKLAICPSLSMMKTLTPTQKVQNLSNMNFPDFYTQLKKMGKGVYIIGLDFHTGFIVNDDHEIWFIHSNYQNRKGVVKEAVHVSSALQSSKTRWLISLTADTNFINKWITN